MRIRKRGRIVDLSGFTLARDFARRIVISCQLGASVWQIHGIGEIERELVPDVVWLRQPAAT
jgi:hypothetical protein